MAIRNSVLAAEPAKLAYVKKTKCSDQRRKSRFGRHVFLFLDPCTNYCKVYLINMKFKTCERCRVILIHWPDLFESIILPLPVPPQDPLFGPVLVINGIEGGFNDVVEYWECGKLCFR